MQCLQTETGFRHKHEATIIVAARRGGHLRVHADAVVGRADRLFQRRFARDWRRRSLQQGDGQ
jgi:hypothetical protein